MMLPNRGGVPEPSLALTCTPPPSVLRIAPRARGAVVALKKSLGRLFGAALASGTASQLISRRPVVCATGSPPLSAPSAVR